MTRYRSRDSASHDVMGGGFIAEVFHGKAEKLRHSTIKTHALAVEAKHMPNVGSTEFRQKMRGHRHRTKFYKELRGELHKRNQGLTTGDIYYKTVEHIGGITNKLYRIEYHAEWLKVARDLGSDLADVAIQVMAEAVSEMEDELFDEFCATMYREWFAKEVQMNNGQITITEEHYLPAITDWLDRQQEVTGVDPSSGAVETIWPDDTDLGEYASMIQGRYSADVWMRAFTDTTESPIGPCEQIREAAVLAKEVSASLNSF